jgi:hypothetical protein
MHNALAVSPLALTAALAAADEFGATHSQAYRLAQTRRDMLVADAKGRHDEADQHMRALTKRLWSKR